MPSLRSQSPALARASLQRVAASAMAAAGSGTAATGASSSASASPSTTPSTLASSGSGAGSALSSTASDASEKFLAPLSIRLSPAVDATNLSFSINEPPTDRPVRIYCDGIFDLFHYGHARCLEQAKKAFTSVHLIVGVCDDAVTHKHKGKTVMSDIERFESVRHCIWVDQVVEGAPWVLDQAFLDKYEIDYVAHDNIPYAASGCDDVYDFVKKQGKFLPTRRTEGISTSDLITRIVRDYDQYLRRNLARGVSPKELNIGFFKQKQLAVERSVQEITDEIKSEFEEWKDDIKETFRNWEQRSSHYVRGFVSLFRNGPGLVVKLLRMKSKRDLRIAGKRRRTPPVTPASGSDSSEDESGASQGSDSSSIVSRSDSEGDSSEETQYHVRGSVAPTAGQSVKVYYDDDDGDDDGDNLDSSRSENDDDDGNDDEEGENEQTPSRSQASHTEAVRNLTRASVIDTKCAKRPRRC